MVPARAVVVYVESECVALAVVVYPGDPLAQEPVLLLSVRSPDGLAHLRGQRIQIATARRRHRDDRDLSEFALRGVEFFRNRLAMLSRYWVCCYAEVRRGREQVTRTGSEAASMIQAETRETRQAEWRAMLRRLRVTQDEIAERLGIQRSAVSNVVRYGEVPEYWWYLAMEIARERIASLPEEVAS